MLQYSMSLAPCTLRLEPSFFVEDVEVDKRL